VGTTSAAKTFTFTNKQNVALTGIAISTSGPRRVGDGVHDEHGGQRVLTATARLAE
jgi:hypothetical protein